MVFLNAFRNPTFPAGVAGQAEGLAMDARERHHADALRTGEQHDAEVAFMSVVVGGVELQAVRVPSKTSLHKVRPGPQDTAARRYSALGDEPASVHAVAGALRPRSPE